MIFKDSLSPLREEIVAGGKHTITTTELMDRILQQLGDVRTRCPELRFGQLMAIVGELAQDDTGHSLWDVEDADFAAALERFSNDMASRESAADETRDRDST